MEKISNSFASAGGRLPPRILVTGHVARMGEERGRIGSWWGNRRERDHWGDLGVDG